MFLKFTKRQYSILIFLSSVYILSTVGIAILTPFYPRTALEKGVSAIYYSSVFSCYNLAWFLVSWFCGPLMMIVDPFVIAKTSTFIIGVTNIFFAYLDKIYNASIFLWLSYITRIIEAYGYATFAVSAFCIAAKEFPDDIGFIIGIFEASQGTGYCLGPAIGGLLYYFGGFTLPFLVLGLFTLFAAIIILFVNGSDVDILLSLNYKEVFKLLRKIEILLAILSELVASVTFGIAYSNLEAHVQILHLSPSLISLFYTIFGISYCVSTLLFGKLCDRGKPPQKLWCIGDFLMCISLMGFGPAPYFNISLNVTLCCFSFIIFGFAAGAIMVSSFFCLHKVALKMGFPDDIRTYSLVSSIYNSLYSIGMMVGAMIGGLFTETIGLAWGFQIAILFFIVVIIITLAYDLTHEENDFPN